MRLGQVAGGFGQQPGAEVQAQVAALEAALVQLPRQLAVAAAQVEDAGGAEDCREEAQHAGLQALAGGGEVGGEGLVELEVECQEALDGGGIHAAIIMGSEVLYPQIAQIYAD